MGGAEVVDDSFDVVVRAQSGLLLDAAAALVALEVARAHGGEVLHEEGVAQHLSDCLRHVAVAPPGTGNPVADLGLVCGEGVCDICGLVAQGDGAHGFVCLRSFSPTQCDCPGIRCHENVF